MNLSEMNWPAVAALSRDVPVVIPVAALEQHGGHMPLFTDSLLLGEVVRRVAADFAERALFVPLVWLGNSDHHLDFQGTLSAPPRVYLDMLVGLADNLVQHGFRRLVFLNGHGGNDVPGRQAVFELRQRHRQRDDVLFLFATYWSLGASPSDGETRFAQKEMGHACEWETSMMLRLAPHLVGSDYQKLEPVPFGNPFLPAARGWITKERSKPGHIGQPHLASAEKGEFLFQHFAGQVAAMLERVIAWDGRTWDA